LRRFSIHKRDFDGAQDALCDPSVYLGLRLAPDMLPFKNQIQIASDNAKGCVARLAGVEIPKYEDIEASVNQLRERIRKTIDFIRSVPAEKFDGAESCSIELQRPKDDPLQFTGEDYLRFFALPNFFFHVTSAYPLRHNGASLGKMDYLGAVQR
jgi:hypothetical protein